MEIIRKMFKIITNMYKIITHMYEIITNMYEIKEMIRSDPDPLPNPTQIPLPDPTQIPSQLCRNLKKGI